MQNGGRATLPKLGTLRNSATAHYRMAIPDSLALLISPHGRKTAHQRDGMRRPDLTPPTKKSGPQVSLRAVS